MTLKQATSRQQRCRTRPLLKVVDAEALPAKTTALNPPQAIVTTVATIVEDVFRNGEAALRRWAFDLGDLQARDASLLIDAAQCRAALTSLAEEDRTMLLVTHDMRFARDVSDKVVFLHQGRIEEEGTPEELFDNPKSERLQQFLSASVER